MMGNILLNKIKKIVKNMIMPGGTLSQKVAKGGFWVFFIRITIRGLSFIRLIILARILSPNDFGLMGIALLTMSILETFSQTGFEQALIHKKEDIESYLNSAWTVLILRGFILFAILYFIAPYAAVFFNTPEAKPIIKVIGFSILFQAFTNIGITYFKKELEFNKEFIYQFSGTLADFVVAVSAVLILKNVWALVFGLLARKIVSCLVSYLIHSYRPRLSSDLGKAKELFGFGKWIMVSSILVFLIVQGDDIFVGKLLGTTALGFYQLAYRISNMATTEITQVISQVTFPTYSKLQNDLPKLREAYLKVLQLIAFLSFPITGLIFVLSPDFTKIFLGEKWMPMVLAMQVLCIFGVTRSINALFGSVLLGIGKPSISTKASAIQLAIIIILIYPLTLKMDIIGTSIVVSFSNVFIMFYLFLKIGPIMKIKYINSLKEIQVFLFATIVMSVSLIIFKNVLIINMEIGKLIILIFIGLVFYFGFIFLFCYFFQNNIRKNLKYYSKLLIDLNSD
ncbi:hypothetical protein ES705_27359 [subsurface metagenome]